MDRLCEVENYDLRAFALCKHDVPHNSPGLNMFLMCVGRNYNFYLKGYKWL